MDRGFCLKEKIRKLSQTKNKFFVIRVKNDMKKLKIFENSNCLLREKKIMSKYE